MDRCSHCLGDAPDDLSYGTASGETLCGPCYFTLWGPTARAGDPIAEIARPVARRDRRPRLRWMVPGPSPELDLEERVRAVLRHRRARRL